MIMKLGMKPLVGLAILAFIGFGVAIGSGVQAQNRTKAAPPRAVAKPVAPTSAPALTATQFDGLMGGRIDLGDYRGKVVLVVNTASQCGFTGQYAGLETLYRARSRDGLVIVGVPSNDFGGQEPGSAGEIKRFCELNYGVTFPMAAKYVVRGPNAHPFYRSALARLGASAEPAWNFHKILVGKNGQPIAAFPSGTTPDSPVLARAITTALSAR
jgi:glutathione peroxidase